MNRPSFNAARFGLTPREWRFGLVISSVHGIQHVFYRLFPPLIPILAVGMDASLWELGLLVSVFLFAGGLGQAPMGILVDRYDRGFVLIPAIVLLSIGYLVFVLGSAIGMFLPSISLLGHTFSGTYQLMACGMFVAGVGYSAIHPVGYPLISANVDAENKATVLGMWGSASKVGDTIAPLLIALFILVIPWEWILIGVSLCGFLYAGWLFVLLQRGTIETQPPARTSGATAPTDSHGSRGPRTFLVPITTILVAFCCVLFATNGLITFAPVFVTDVYGYSLSVAGLEVPPASVANVYFSALLISGAVSQLIVGAIANRYDYRFVLLGLLAATTLGLVVLATLQLTPLALLAVFVIVGGCLFGLNPVRDALISDLTPAAYEGRIFGSFWTVVLLVSSGYPLFIGYLGDTVGVQASFGFLAAGTVLGMAVIGLLYSPRIYRQRTTSTDAPAD